MNHAPESTRNAGLSTDIDRLEQVTEKLQAVLAEHEDRLRPILDPPDVAAPPGLMAKETEQLSEIRIRVQMVTDRIQYAAGQLHGLTDRAAL